MIQFKNKTKLSALLVLGASAIGCAVSPMEEAGNENVATSEQALFSKSVGMHYATEPYQDVYVDIGSGLGYYTGWLPDVSATANTVMNGFKSTIDDEANVNFAYGLRNKKYYWEDTGDHAANSLETVDMFVTYTHGGIRGDNRSAEWGMWEAHTNAESDQMSLGNESVGTSIFAQWSCETLHWDSQIFDRWGKIFRGGLRYAVGSGGTLPAGSETGSTGTWFAQKLNAGATLSQAWTYTWDTAPYDNADASILASGTTPTECTTRRDNMSWENFKTYARRQNTEVAYLCGWTWDDL